MNKPEYMAFHKECCTRMVCITEKKNADYSGKGNDPFANFRRHGALGFLVRMHDKMARLESFVEKGSFEVSDESFEDTCLDLANYSILLNGFMQEQKQGERNAEKESQKENSTT